MAYIQFKQKEACEFCNTMKVINCMSVGQGVKYVLS